MARLDGKVLFVPAVTGILALVGWLNGQGTLPGIRLGAGPGIFEALPPTGRSALLLWMGTAAVVGLVLPTLALARWGRQEVVRRVLLPYVGILLVQLLTEWWFTQTFGWYMGPLTGLIYTTYRIGQLRSARKSLALSRPYQPGRHVLLGLLGLAFTFWSANLAMLVMVALPRVVSL